MSIRDPVLDAIFLADDAVAGSLRIEQLAHRGFRLAIGARDRGMIRFGFDTVLGAEIGADRGARDVCEAVSEVDIGLGDRHRGCLSRDGDPR